MRLKELYELIVRKGIEFDPRGREGVKKSLAKVRQGYRKLSKKDKKEFDLETLVNPYSDTRILYGDPKKEIRKLLVGIDMEVGELLLADRLNEKRERIDLVMAHHPEGRALAGLYQVMHIQTDILNKVGVSMNAAEGLMKERISEVERVLLPVNHTRSVDVARLLDIPFMCCHTPADNCVTTYLSRLMKKKGPRTVGDVVDVLKEIPEYKEAIGQKAGPRIICGEKTSKAGKVFVDMTGGTEGSKKVFARLSQAGVGTIVCMHLSEEHFKMAKEEYINVIIAGHMASDTLGLNLLLDEIEKEGRFNIISCSGFKRVER
ncbi:MAG: NGG1p interacting factor NIF3 [Candidatus Omnitrophica bacterium]|nr:NGG1p interacting factor NIF3 [Candidatus Omnitrophota bacterium]